MKNLIIYENNCKEDVLSKVQLDKKHSEYSIGKTLFATSDRGRKAYQDDSVIILEHQSNNNIKLIAVADGVGSSIDGNLASNHVIKKIIEWFEKINNFDVNQVKISLQEMLKNVLYDLRANVYAATTLSAAIVLEDETLIANIGDSRVYILKNNQLSQITRDDSKVQILLEEEVIPNKELTRFHKNSNILLSAIAFYPPYYQVKYKTISNDYDKLLATTDGVTDCLSTKQIEDILRNYEKEASQIIVKDALTLDSYLEKIIQDLPKYDQKVIAELQDTIEEDYVKYIKGGKDNTTAAIYIRK